VSDGKSILLIDSHHEDRQYYAHRLSLSSPDCTIFEAADGRTGLKIYQACSIDCVVLELDLPDMSGFEVLVKLIPIVHQPEIAVIVLTRLPAAVLLDLALKNGALAALYKSRTSGDDLDKKILQAVSAVTKDRKRAQEPLGSLRPV
jgi:DNA-binding NarL/FixJ family response regulator